MSYRNEKEYKELRIQDANIQLFITPKERAVLRTAIDVMINHYELPSFLCGDCSDHLYSVVEMICLDPNRPKYSFIDCEENCDMEKISNENTIEQR